MNSEMKPDKNKSYPLKRDERHVFVYKQIGIRAVFRAFQYLAYAPPFMDLFPVEEEEKQRQPDAAAEDVDELELFLARLLRFFLGPSISDRSLSISILW